MHGKMCHREGNITKTTNILLIYVLYEHDHRISPSPWLQQFQIFSFLSLFPWYFLVRLLSLILNVFPNGKTVNICMFTTSSEDLLLFVHLDNVWLIVRYPNCSALDSWLLSSEGSIMYPTYWDIRFQCFNWGPMILTSISSVKNWGLHHRFELLRSDAVEISFSTLMFAAAFILLY